MLAAGEGLGADWGAQVDVHLVSDFFKFHFFETGFAKLTGFFERVLFSGGSVLPNWVFEPETLFLVQSL